MVVESSTYSADYDSTAVVLRAVYGDSEENKSFSKWTPSAQLQINITNPDAASYFEVGKEYILDFKLAE